MKKQLNAVLLALFGGIFGLHKFYLGRPIAGVLYAIFFWAFIPALLSLIDIYLLLFLSEENFNRKYNRAPQSGDLFAELSRAKELFDAGALTEAEFLAIKNAALDR